MGKNLICKYRLYYVSIIECGWMYGRMYAYMYIHSYTCIGLRTYTCLTHVPTRTYAGMYVRTVCMYVCMYKFSQVY